MRGGAGARGAQVSSPNEQKERCPRQKVTETARDIEEPTAEFEIFAGKTAGKLPAPGMRDIALLHLEETGDRPGRENSQHAKHTNEVRRMEQGSEFARPM